jgi:hypothetical protein
VIFHHKISQVEKLGWEEQKKYLMVENISLDLPIFVCNLARGNNFYFYSVYISCP